MNRPAAAAADTTVLGGGAAGLAAALALAREGCSVRLLEARSRLGGRAFSFHDPRAGAALDNGPHVVLGCYEAFGWLLEELGTQARFEGPSHLRLAFREAGGKRHVLRAPPLPGPLHVLGAVARFTGLRLGERAALAGALAWAGVAASPARPEETVDGWLSRRGLGGGPARFFFHPLCRAVMNEDPARASAALLLRTLKVAFGGGPGASAVRVPSAPWSEILGDAALQTLARRGVEVRLRSGVRALSLQGGRVASVVLADGEEVPCGPVVLSALPWHALFGLLAPHGASLPALEPSPLVSVHLDWEGAAGDLDGDGLLVALVDGCSFHWLTRRAGDPPSRLCVLSGGDRRLAALSRDAIVARAAEDLLAHYPGAALCPEVRARALVVREPAATFSPLPGVDRLRPGVEGPLGLLLAGDWTATGLPATLEGAARSGKAAAAAALARLRAAPLPA